MPITVGIHYETFDPIQKQRQVWRAVDEAGFDQIWNADHLSKTPSSGDPTGPILDAWTALGALAADTKRARLGALGTADTRRHPPRLAQTAAAGDPISGARLDRWPRTAWTQH